MNNYQDVFVACTDCGISVFQYQGQRYIPVAGYLLTGQIIGPNRDIDVGFRRAYVEHQCRPEDIEKHSELTKSIVAALEILIEDNPPRWLQEDLLRAASEASNMREKLKEVVLRTGLNRPCPRCDAQLGEPCGNLAERKRGNRVHTKNPHDERLPLVGTVEASELDLARSQAGKAHGLVFQIQEQLRTDNALVNLRQLVEGL